MDRFEIYKTPSGSWNWRFMKANGRVVARSASGYARKGIVKKAIEKFITAVGKEVPIKEVA